MYKAAIFGVPRSGTSWLSQIFNSHPAVVMRYQPLFSYGHKGRLSQQSSAEDIDNFFNEILHSQDPFTLMQTEYHNNYPKYVKTDEPTHIIFKETRYLNIINNLLLRSKDIRIIGIVRNPLATLASWIQAPKEFDASWDIFKEWRWAHLKNQGRPEEFYGFEKWKQVASDFLRYEKEYPEQFLLLTYSGLISDPLGKTKELLGFCSLTLDRQVEQFIIESRSRHDPDPYSVYRAKASDQKWRSVLPPEIAEKIMSELAGTQLEQFLD